MPRRRDEWDVYDLVAHCTENMRAALISRKRRLKK